MPEGRDEAVGECDRRKAGVQCEVRERGAEAEDNAPAEHRTSWPHKLVREKGLIRISRQNNLFGHLRCLDDEAGEREGHALRHAPH